MSKIIRTEYEIEKNRPVVYVFSREGGKRVITKDASLVPYMYVKESDKGKTKFPVTSGFTAIDGTKLVKVSVNIPADVPILRDKFEQTWEADILFGTRYLIDKVDNLEPVDVRTCWIDIETDNQGRVPSAKTAPEPVLCITCLINDIYTTFLWRSDLSPGTESKVSWGMLHEIKYFRNEEDMLNALITYLHDEEPDVISGWNVVAFDLTYLISRMKRLSIEPNRMSPMRSVFIEEGYGKVKIKGVSVIDLFDAYRRFSEEGVEESYALDAIGKKVVGFGKNESSSNVKWLWKHDIEKLIEYNSNDCRITAAIDNKMQLISFLNELRQLCYCQLEDSLTISKMADSYILRMFHNRKVFPTKLHHEREEFEGAYVDSWANGLHENVVVFDVKSLYPSIIVSANLSPESIAPDDAKGKNIIALGDVRVDLSIKGFLPEVINSLFVERTKFKSLMKKEKLDSDMYKFYDMRQKSVKRLLNALYGQTAFPNSRIFNSKVAEAITWTGREIIKWSKNFLEDIGYKVIYVDTDSTHVLFDDISISNITMILGMLNDSYKEFVSNLKLPSNIFEMDFEKIYRKAFYGHETKKRYAGYIVYKDGKEADKLDIWGFEAKRSDSSQFSRNLQRKVFDMILKENKSKDEVMHFVGDEIARIRSGNFKFTEIGVPKGMSKDPEDYGKDVVDINGVVEKDAQGRRVKKGVPANIRGAKYTQDNLGFELSSKPKMIYIAKMPDRYPKTDVLCFDEDVQVPPGVVLDVETTLKKSVNDKLDSIFDSLGWEMRELNIFWKGKPKNKMGDQQVMEL